MEHIEILENDRIPKKLVIGQKYHCTWANTGCVWVLKALNGKEAILETPRTRKETRTHEANLRLLNYDALQVAKKRVEDYEQLLRDEAAEKDNEEPGRCAWCDAILINDKEFCSKKCCEDAINER